MCDRSGTLVQHIAALVKEYFKVSEAGYSKDLSTLKHNMREVSCGLEGQAIIPPPIHLAKMGVWPGLAFFRGPFSDPSPPLHSFSGPRSPCRRTVPYPVPLGPPAISP